MPLIDTARNALIEGIIAESEDETLMERYLGGEDIDLKVLIDDLEKAVARGSFYPVLAAGRADRARHGRAARGHHPGVPVAAGARGAAGHQPGRRAARAR